MRKQQKLSLSEFGFSFVELMVTVGILSVLSLAVMTLLNSSFLGISSARKSASRNNQMQGISLALREKQTCGDLLNAGTLSIPADWATGAGSPVSMSSLQVGSETLAQVGTVIEEIETQSIRLEKVSGPYPIRYNVASPPAPADLRNYNRYFAKLIVSLKKSGNTGANLGGIGLRDSEFRVSFLADDTNKLFDCFGGIDESDLVAICEKAFEGEHDAAFYPWCKLNRLAVGMRMSEFGPVQPRVLIRELASSASPDVDMTMVLLGNPGGNGPGLSLFADIGGGHIGAAGRPSAFGSHSQPGDLVLTTIRDLHFATNESPSVQPTRVYIRNNGQVGINTLVPGMAQMKVEANTTSPQRLGLAVGNTLGQGSILISGASDSGETHSAIYLSDAETSDPKANSWVFAHKGPSASGAAHHSFQINRWAANAMQAGLTITPNMRVGIGTLAPTEKLHVAGDTRIQGALNVTGPAPTNITGNLQVTGNIHASGTVTASSDRRLKTEIRPLEQALAQVHRMRPVSFSFRASSADPTDQRRHIGFIAQELEKVVPEVVHTDETGMKSVAYGNLVATAIAAIQEMLAQLLSFEKNQDEMADRLTALERRIERMAQHQEQLTKRNTDLEQSLRECRRPK